MATKTPQDRKKKAAATEEEVEVKKPTGDEKTIMDFINTLDMDDLDYVENLSGMSLEELEVPGRPKSRFLYAVGLVAKKRTDSSFSWADIRKLPMSEIGKFVKDAPAKKYETETTTDSEPKPGA